MSELDSIRRVSAHLGRLPGIGNKTAQRLAYHLMDIPVQEVEALCQSILDARHEVRFCSVCGSYSAEDVCPICKDGRRDHHLICVVETPRDVLTLERMHSFHGVYHVLHGVISPMRGIGPDDISIPALLQRLPEAEEVILATNPNVEGEATASYIAQLVRQSGKKVTRLAHGMPVGGELEYTDEITLSRALEGRQEI